MASYTKSDLLTDVAARAGADVSKAQVETVISAFFDTIVSKTQDGAKVAWPGFGSFQTSVRPARKGRNPQTGATIEIPETTVMKFSAAKALKDALNE